MSYRFRIFLISFIVSLPFWLGINILAFNLEEIWFLKEIVKSPEIFTAQIGSLVLKKEVSSQKENKLILDNLETGTSSILSIEIDSQGNEKILFEKNSQKELPIASLGKLMTALVVFDFDETYELSQIIKISKEAVNQEGSSKYGELKEGESFSLETVLNVMLIESSNDAAYAIGEVIGQEGFVDLMNLKAKSMGLENTHFVNLTGLEDGELKNVSTARDLVKLSEYILNKYPEIFEITTKSSYEVFNSDNFLHHFIPQNTNELLSEFPGIIGGKTGWDREARGCLLLIVKNKNNYVIYVVLGAEDRFEEMRKLMEITK